jgi:predicted unusual protein kinase regulating ubiquinone biosynthesis (AarF/ABC1/UbiB family)
MEFHVSILYCVALTCRPEKADSIEELHKRVAKRIMDLISANGGLYIKLGIEILQG